LLPHPRLPKAILTCSFSVSAPVRAGGAFLRGVLLVYLTTISPLAGSSPPGSIDSIRTLYFTSPALLKQILAVWFEPTTAVPSLENPLLQEIRSCLVSWRVSVTDPFL